MEFIIVVAIIAALIVIIFAVLIVIRDSDIKKDRIQKIESELEKINSFSSSQYILGVESETGIAIDEERKKVCLISIFNENPFKHEEQRASLKIIEYKDILSSEIVEDGSTLTKTSRTSQIGSALIGGIVFGGVGAVIGGLTGKTKTTGKVKNVDLAITVNDTQNPLHSIKLMNVECDQGGFVHKAAMENARHWHNLITVLIKRADAEDDKQKNIITNNDTQLSIADELHKLNELKKDGILSNNEFEQQKTKLLGSTQQFPDSPV